MALELEGTLRQKMGVQQGTSARGQWAKQEFILDYPDGNYTSQAVFTAFGQDKVTELDKYQTGDRIRVSFNIKSREYNGRWYTDLQVWRVAPAGSEAARPASSAQPMPSASPVPPPPAFEAPAPTLDDMPGESADSDDLPF